MAMLTVVIGADQIVVGIGIDIFAAGVTGYAFRRIFTGHVVLARPSTIELPGLSSIPFVGGTLFNQTLLVYTAFVIAGLCWFGLQRTKWGLAVRATGELPDASDAAGVGVQRLRVGR